MPDTLRDLVFLGDPQISPDGSTVIYVHKRADRAGTWRSTLVRTDADGSSSPVPFTNGPRDRLPRWSPEGTTIAFLRADEKHLPQLALISEGGGEARPLTNFPEGTIGEFAWSPDGTTIAVAFRATGAPRTEAERTRRERDEESSPPLVTESEWYRLDGDGVFGEDRFELHLVDVATGAHRRLFADDTLGTFSFSWFPDGRSLAVSANRHPRALLEPWRTELLRVDARRGRVTKIPGAPQGAKTHVRVSPDGRFVAWAGRDDEEGIYSTENIGLWVLDLESRQAQCLTDGTDDCLMAVGLTDAAEAVFAPIFFWCEDSKRILVRIGRSGETRLCAAHVGRPGLTDIAFEAGRDLDVASITPEGRSAAFVSARADEPPEIAIGRMGRGRAATMSVRTRTAHHEALRRHHAFAPLKRKWVTADDGHQTEVFALFPPGLGKDERVPAILQIHGGPHARYGVGFFHEFQTLVRAGYAVFFSNPRGSKGYGRDHCAAIRGAWGDRDWADIRAVADAMQTHRNVDPERMGVMGGSYGGYMTNWAIAHDHRFRAAITDRCVSNLVSMGGTSDYIEAPGRYFPGNFWDQPESRWAQSPIAHFGNVRTPLLIIHSEGDLRCNIEQAEQIFSCLRLREIPCRFIRYPATTSHGMSRSGPPDLRIHRLGEILAWWNRWLGDGRAARKKRVKR